MPAGRPSKYKPGFAKQAIKLCELGATDPEIAAFFEVHEATLYRWCNTHPEFREALKSGKAPSDDRVERSLFKRATGYEIETVKIFMPAGAKKPVYAKYVEHIPPDPASAIFWLKNRRSKEWRDKAIQEMTGPDGAPLTPQVNVTITRSQPQPEPARKAGPGARDDSD